MRAPISLPMTQYRAGDVVVRRIEDLGDDVAGVRVTLSRDNWSGSVADSVARVALSWLDGPGVESTLPGGSIVTKDGTPLAASSLDLAVPEIGDGQHWIKRKVSAVVLRVEFLADLTTAIEFEAR